MMREGGVMSRVLERLPHALNRRDLDAMLECFDPDYRSEQPAHPNRGLGGKEQVRKNWSGMFESFPDFEAELLRNVTEGQTVWSEWRWTATGLDMAGVIIMGVEEERIVWARLYMEPVEEDGQGIDEAMNTIAEGAPREGDVSSEEASPT
jgi:hypothetical protein